ncbi:MAG: primosomal replication protein N [Betaproteobacteria bacterium]|nr:primosomal replication protein N [Betaproteobacteria bacterium]
MEPGNRVEIAGKLLQLEPLRHTPGGVAVVKFTLGHESTQVEAEAPRKVGCEIDGVAFDREARLLATASLGMQLSIRGFLDRKSRNSRQLVLHATQIEFTKTSFA